MPKMKKYTQVGFTLVELVTVIILLGVVGTFSSRFIADNVVLYQSSVNQNERLNDARFVINRMSKELDSAIAFSVVVNNTNDSCMSFVPFTAAGQYINTVAMENSIELIMDPITRSGSGAVNTFDDQHLSVLTTNSDEFYSSPLGDTLANISSYTRASGAVATLGLDTALTFDSPVSRYFIAGNKVRYCLAAGQLRRSEVLLTESFPSPISTSGVLMADNLAVDSRMSLTSASQFSNAILELDFRFLLRDGNEIKFEHQVVMSNVP